MSGFGLPAEVRDRLPSHRRSVGTEPQSGAPEFWIVGKCSGCGNEWARHGEGQTWDATCRCGGEIRPRRGDRPGAECIADSEAAWGISEALVAFRMPEAVSLSITANWSGAARSMREQQAHIDAGWPIYSEPPADEEGFVAWAVEEFRFGPQARPIRIAPDRVGDLVALDCIKETEKEGHTILRCPFGDLIVVDCDPGAWLKRLKAERG